MFAVIKDQVLSLYKFRWLFPFMIAGFYYNKQGYCSFLRKFKMNSNIMMICAALGITILINYSFLAVKHISMLIDYYMINENGIDICGMLWWFGGGIVGCVTVFLIAESLNIFCKSGWIQKIGEYSLDIYVLHMFFVYIIRELMLKLSNVFLKNMLACFISILVSIIIYYIDKRILRKSKLFRISIGLI